MNVVPFIIMAGVIVYVILVSRDVWRMGKDRRKKKAQEISGRTFSLNTQNQSEVAQATAQTQQNKDPVHILFEVSNGELRQSLIKEAGGFEALISKVKHDIIHEDEYGVLFRVWAQALSKYFYYVKVVNGTVENDGSRRVYYKEVPPDMDTAKEAVAWTYGLHPDDYEISIRT